ncbi:hypothetical protein HZH66_013620 [Vespula vulgaris]|uniref:Uncharacterized protein n=1 Tax=Vespula vulgaris TaxID=7454 RepID=A0A834MTC0_VESVU|nr:hypothetical protein HZH66_013620 [Vespula vulgaris]
MESTWGHYVREGAIFFCGECAESLTGKPYCWSFEKERSITAKRKKEEEEEEEEEEKEEDVEEVEKLQEEEEPLVELLIFEFDMYPVLALLDNILVILPREDNSVGICASKRKMIQLIHIDLNCIFKCVRNNGGHFIDPIDFYLNRIFVQSRRVEKGVEEEEEEVVVVLEEDGECGRLPYKRYSWPHSGGYMRPSAAWDLGYVVSMVPPSL